MCKRQHIMIKCLNQRMPGYILITMNDFKEDINYEII